MKKFPTAFTILFALIVIVAALTWIIPAGGGVVRNMMRTRDGNLALAESGVNRVALVTIGASS